MLGAEIFYGHLAAIYAGEKADAFDVVDQVDRPRVPVNLLMIPERLASVGRVPEF
jgi:hypothetical protein